MSGMAVAVELPSKELLRRLEDLGLADERRVLGCRRGVRHLARDLPIFDSVWIDALVQERVLTPYQGRAFQESESDSLQIGNWIITDRISSDGFPQAYHVLRRGTVDQFLLTKIKTAATSARLASDLLLEGRDRLGRFETPGLNRILDAGFDDDGVFAISPIASGPTLHDRLISSGRLPWMEVHAVLTQALRILTALEGAGSPHGDVRLRNLVLSPGGTVQLLNHGLVATVRPCVSFHDDWPIECLDVVAPETIGPNGRRTHASDLYSLGVTVWQLLSGRPPHPTNDPISKLVAHQRRDIEDVRNWAPDVPAELANVIQAMTRREASARPATAKAALAMLGRAPRRVQRAGAIPVRSPQRNSASRSTVFRNAGLALTSVAGLLATAVWISTSKRPLETMSLSAPRPDAPTEDAAPPSLRSRIQNGILTLDDSQVWRPEAITQSGSLEIRAAAGTQPVFEITDQPLQLASEQVVISGIEFRTASSTGTAMIVVDAQRVQLDGCRFLGPDVSNSPDAAVLWRPLERTSGADARLLVKNSEFAGSLTGVDLSSGGGQVACDNVLKVGSGPLLVQSSKSAEERTSLHVRQSTLRGSTPVLRSPELRTQIHLDRCVFELTESAILESTEPTPDIGLARRLRVSGSPSFASLGSVVAGRREANGGLTPFAMEDEITGLVFDELQFEASPTPERGASQIRETTVPIAEATLPGIRPTR
jgi:serine/threonine protein kinase